MHYCKLFILYICLFDFVVGVANVLGEHVQKSSKWTACWTWPGRVLDIASIVSDHFRTWTPYDRTEDGQYICSM